MKTLRHNISSAGYDREEAFFFERDQELIKKLRQRPKLELIQGGKSDASAQRVEAAPQTKGKKAA